jgi:hypothetical protein
MYASHFGLIIRKCDGLFELAERYGKKRPIGTYHTVDALERGIIRHNQRMLMDRDAASYGVSQAELSKEIKELVA